MDIGKKVSILLNDNTWSKKLYKIIEIVDEYVIVTGKNGQNIRLFHDRIQNPKLSTKETSMTTSKTASKDIFDPNTIYPKAQKEIWVKENSFNATTVCKTLVIINMNNHNRYVINTYDGIAKGGSEYKIKDMAKMIAKLKNDGYVLDGEKKEKKTEKAEDKKVEVKVEEKKDEKK